MRQVSQSKVKIDQYEVHRRLRNIRKDAGLNLNEVGPDTGIGEQYLGQMEKDRFLTGWNHIITLAAYYDTTTDYLLAVPWCGNPERNPKAASTSEAIKAGQLLDSFPPAVRAVMLQMIEQQASIFRSLVSQTSENITLRLAIAEYTAMLSPEQLKISESTVAERLTELLATDLG